MPYKTKVEYSFEEAKKAFWATYIYKNKAGITAAIVALIVFAAFIVNGVWTGNYENVFVFSIVLVLYPIIIYILATKRIRKNYESYKMLHGTTFSYTFFEDAMVSDGPKGTSKIAYKDLYKITETKTNFYIFVSSIQAFSIIKSGCSEELISFIQKLKTEVNGRIRTAETGVNDTDYEQLYRSVESNTDILYNAKVEWEIDELKDFNWLLIKNIHKPIIVVLVIVEIMFLTGFVISFPAHSLRLAIESILLAIVVPVLFYSLFNYRCRKNFDSNKLLRNFVAIITFDSEKLEQISNVGSIKASYDEIYRIFETDKNFYILISDNLAINVRKANCSDGLITFLQDLKQKVA